MKSLAEYPDVLRISDLREILHIGRNKAYELLQNSIIRSKRVGKKYIIPKSAVLHFLQGMEDNNINH